MNNFLEDLEAEHSPDMFDAYFGDQIHYFSINNNIITLGYDSDKPLENVESFYQEIQGNIGGNYNIISNESKIVIIRFKS